MEKEQFESDHSVPPVAIMLSTLDTQNYTIIIVATDNGMPEPLNTTADVTIAVVSPDNFHNPVLNQTSYSATVNENRPPGDVIVEFTVFDSDQTGPASQIGQLYLISSDAQFFRAEITGPNTGRIITK